MPKLGETAPDFNQDSTKGPISFHDHLGDSWGILFSHPADFTPVCTTELGTVASLLPEFAKRNTKVLALSVDSVDSHNEWVGDIERVSGSSVDYPILADEDRSVATAYGMLHPDSDTTLTVRSVFIVDPAKKVRLTLTYPAATGRNFDEILRVLDGLQLTDSHKVATPANWKNGDDVVIVPSIQDPAELENRFPKGYEAVTPYLRMTPDPR